ncbi:MAG TPA: thioredoxin, partial [Acidimicrobiales bacterium]|nr:thioredoxin [Acidimicrobiales bacterium]
RARLLEELSTLLILDADEIARGAGGVAEGVPEEFADIDLPKFRPGGLLIAHAGGPAGLFSAVIGGWASGEMGSHPVTREVRS